MSADNETSLIRESCTDPAATLAVALASQAQAVIEIDISDPTSEPLPIAVTDFTGGSAQAGDLGAQIAAVIAADLERSGLFRPIDRARLHPERG